MTTDELLATSAAAIAHVTALQRDVTAFHALLTAHTTALDRDLAAARDELRISKSKVVMLSQRGHLLERQLRAAGLTPLPPGHRDGQEGA